SQSLIQNERLDNGCRIGESGGFDEDMVYRAATREQISHGPRQVSSDSATDAPVVQLEDILLGAYYELAVDANVATFIDNNGNTLRVPTRQDMVQQCGFARTEKSGKDRRRDVAHYVSEATRSGRQVAAYCLDCYLSKRCANGRNGLWSEVSTSNNADIGTTWL